MGVKPFLYISIIILDYSNSQDRGSTQERVFVPVNPVGANCFLNWRFSIQCRGTTHDRVLACFDLDSKPDSEPYKEPDEELDDEPDEDLDKEPVCEPARLANHLEKKPEMMTSSVKGADTIVCPVLWSFLIISNTDSSRCCEFVVVQHVSRDGDLSDVRISAA